MRLDVPTLVIICVCAIAGYLVFDISYIPDERLAIYTIELPITDEIEYYRVDGGSHTFYYLTRDFQETHEILTVRNDLDEHLTLYVKEMPSQNPINFEFIPLNEERNIMFLNLFLQELVLIGVCVFGIVVIKRKTQVEEDLLE